MPVSSTVCGGVTNVPCVTDCAFAADAHKIASTRIAMDVKRFTHPTLVPTICLSQGSNAAAPESTAAFFPAYQPGVNMIG